MLTSKARAELRARTHDLDLIVTVGKSGITDNLIRETDLALQARELIKCQVLDEVPYDEYDIRPQILVTETSVYEDGK